MCSADGFNDIVIEIRNAEAKAHRKEQSKRGHVSRGKQQRRLKCEGTNHEELAALKREFLMLQQKMARAESMDSRRKAWSKKRADRHPGSTLKLLSEREKSELMCGIGALPEEKLDTLVSIVAPGQRNSNEVELDLDGMTEDIYNKVKRFLHLHTKRSEFRTPHEYDVASPRPLSDARDDESESSSDSEDD